MNLVELEYIIPLKINEIKSCDENLSFLLEYIAKIYPRANIHILAYGLNASGRMIETLFFQNLVKKNTKIKVYFSDSNFFSHALKYLIDSEKILIKNKILFFLDPKFLFKKIIDSSILSDIIEDINYNQDIGWINFLSELENGNNTIKDFSLIYENQFSRNASFFYTKCLNPKLSLCLIKGEILSLVINNINNFNNPENIQPILDNKKHRVYKSYVFIFSKNTNNYNEKNKDFISDTIPLICGDFNSEEKQCMQPYKDELYTYLTHSSYKKFKIYFNNKQFNFKKESVNYDSENFEDTLFLKGEEGDVRCEALEDKEDLFIDNHLIIFNTKTAHALIKKGKVRSKTKESSAFFENCQSSQQDKNTPIPINIKYLYETFPEKIYKKYSNFFEYSNFSKNFFGYLEDKTFYPKIYNSICGIKNTFNIPKIVHLTYGFSKDTEFYFVYYLCILSILEKIKPDKILFYYTHEPSGIWWEKIKNKVTLVQIKNANYFFNNKILHYAHISDIVRLEALRYCGGIYLDLDVIVNRSFDSLLSNKCVMSIQNTKKELDFQIKKNPELNQRAFYGLCNAVILAEKSSVFIDNYIQSYKTFGAEEQRKWDHFAVVAPYLLSEKFKNEILVLKDDAFFPFYWGDVKSKIFGENIFDFIKLKNSFCFHLWESGRFFLEKNMDLLKSIDFNYIKTVKNNFTKVINSLSLFDDLKKSSISLLLMVNQDFLKTKIGLDSCLEYTKREDIKEIIVYNYLDNPNFKKYFKEIEKKHKLKIINGSLSNTFEIKNYLFSMASGDLIFFIELPIIINNEGFFENVKFILEDRNIGICGPIGTNKHSYKDFLPEEKEQVVDIINGCCQFFRKSLIENNSINKFNIIEWWEDRIFSEYSINKNLINFKISSLNFYYEWKYDPVVHQPNFYYINKRYKEEIPLKIFQTWGTKNMSKEMEESVFNLKNLNAEFDHYLFDDLECLNFIEKYFNKDVFDAYKTLIPGTFKADLWRYCILYVYGGIYLDIKFKPFKDFKFIELIEKEHYVRDIPESGSGIYNGLMVCKPKNHKLLLAIAKVVDNVKNNFYGYSSLEPTGCLLLKPIIGRENVDLFLSLKWNMTSILKDNKVILNSYKEYRNDQKEFYKKNNTDNYLNLWNSRAIYLNEKD